MAKSLLLLWIPLSYKQNSDYKEGNCKAVNIDNMATDNRENLSAEELEWQNRRKERTKRMRLEKEKQLKRQQLFKRLLPVAAVVLLVSIIGIVMVVGGKSSKEKAPGEIEADKNTLESAEEEADKEAQAGNTTEDAIAMQSTTVSGGVTNAAVPESPSIAVSTAGQYSAHTTDNTQAPPEEVNSTNVVFIDLESGDILAQRNYKEVVSPASMTKVLTILVAAEHVTDLDDTFTMTVDITDYSFSNDCSNVGFEVGEVITVRDLFYGTVLPSGGDAAVGLATYVAGSHEAFVDLMNDKLEELGLSDTAHFTNCVGLYDENHYCTVYDMAMIMEAALENELCREVLGARTYTTSVTPEHPEGITISNWFIRRIEDKDTGGRILGAKTGYVNESGNCAVSYGVDASGKGYVCVTTGAHSSWRCIYDHVELYKKYAQK